MMGTFSQDDGSVWFPFLTVPSLKGALGCISLCSRGWGSAVKQPNLMPLSSEAEDYSNTFPLIFCSFISVDIIRCHSLQGLHRSHGCRHTKYALPSGRESSFVPPRMVPDV